MASVQAACVNSSRTHALPRPRLRSKGRRKFVVVAMLLTTIGALALVGRNELERHVRQKIVPSLSQRLGLAVALGQIHFGLGTATLREIEVRGSEDLAGAPLLRVREAKVQIDLKSLLHGEIVVEHIAVQGVAARLRRSADGKDNVSDLMRSLLVEGKQSDGTQSRHKSGRLRMSDASLSAKDIKLTVEDESTGATLVLKSQTLSIDRTRAVELLGADLSAQLPLRGHLAFVELQSARIRLSPEGEIKIWAEHLKTGSRDPRVRSLLDANSATRVYLERVRGQKGEWQVSMSGELAGAEAMPTSAAAEVPTSAAGVPTSAAAEVPTSAARETFLVIATLQDSESVELRVAGRNLKLARMAPLLFRFKGLSVDKGLASGEWSIHATRNIVQAAGKMSLDGVSLNNPRLASVPVAIRPTQLSAQVYFDRRRGELRLDEVVATSGKVPYRLSLATLLPGYLRANHAAPRVAARVEMPEVPCQDMLNSLPLGLAPELDGFDLQGNTRGEVSLLIDWSDFDLSELDSTVEMDGCRVVHAPKHMSAERLRNSFEHRVPVPGGWRSFLVGPQNPDFVALDKVSSHLKRSFLTTEDSAFYRHEGFITREFRAALVKNLKRARFAYGASSISMQVVKNVLLSREKTVSRKLQELFLTWHMEKALTKDRILEIYVNAIEFGPGLYGIGPASRQYFAKDPRHLNPVESAFLASLLPAPSKRYKQYCGGYVRRSTSAKIERILGFMRRRHRLDEEQYAAALETPLNFRGRRSALCKQSTTNNEGRNS